MSEELRAAADAAVPQQRGPPPRDVAVNPATGIPNPFNAVFREMDMQGLQVRPLSACSRARSLSVPLPDPLRSAPLPAPGR